MRHLGAVCCVLAVVAGCNGGDPAPTDGTATITHVVDGDTIDVRIGGRDERVRLIGIDTPETKKPNAPIECYGPEATAFTTSLLPVGSTVRIERDVVGRDDYGRLLGYVYVLTDGSTGTFVNMEIIRQGYATPMTIEPNSTFARDFAETARSAEAAGLGLWSTCSS
ncbi:MAG TPA: thermonuclease family protein [Ilumatobacteraceae bacterium]|nr:thermonuclease family protein [Ilumatobacteraceae bacterium]